MKLALCQMRMSADEQTNLERGLDALHRAAAAGADLIVYPELQLHLFFPQYEGRDAADKLLTLESPIVRQFQDACRAEGIMAAPNFYLREAGGCFDTTILIGADGALIGRQKMVHIAQAPQFYEQDYYTPSDDGFLVFDTPHGCIGVVVCFDRHYPESIRTEALDGRRPHPHSHGQHDGRAAGAVRLGDPRAGVPEQRRRRHVQPHGARGRDGLRGRLDRDGCER